MSKTKTPPGVKPITKNRRAYYDYEIEEKIEAGMVLKGTEVKSLRDAKVQMGDAFAQIERGEAYLLSLHIAEYGFGNINNHDPTRKRKLLLNRHELDRLGRKVREKGYSLIPLELYFKHGKAKVLLGLAKGKKAHDKRRSIRDKDVKREMERER